MYPRKYFPDLTTRARREEIDSEDLAAFDFLVGAMAVRFLVSRESRGLEVIRQGREMMIVPVVDRREQLHSLIGISRLSSSNYIQSL